MSTGSSNGGRVWGGYYTRLTSTPFHNLHLFEHPHGKDVKNTNKTAPRDKKGEKEAGMKSKCNDLQITNPERKTI